MASELSDPTRGIPLRPGGFDFAEQSDKPASCASLFWDEALDHTLLHAHPGPAGDRATSFEVRRYGDMARILIDGAGEHLSLSDGFRRIQIDLLDGTLLDGPVTVLFIVKDDVRLATRLHALTQFRKLRETGRFDAVTFPPERRAPRWILELRAFDGLTAGATTRDLARALFPERSQERRWRDDDSLRSAVRRLCINARRRVAGGYRALLS